MKTMLVLALTAALLPTMASAQATAVKRADVETRGAHVMPFSQSDSMHMFEPTPRGGVQTVMVQDGDSKQIALVRSHLRKEATAFARGDYTAPAAVHGMAMPGLAALRDGAKRMRIHYASIVSGATITYTSQDPQLISALHRWFAAQVDQHGSHAMMKM